MCVALTENGKILLRNILAKMENELECYQYFGGKKCPNNEKKWASD